MTRRRFVKLLTSSLFTLLGMIATTYAYAYYIEPQKIIHKKRQILSPKIPEVFSDLKIVQFTDTHLGFHYSLEQFGALVKRMNAQNPDIVVFTGDLIDRPQTFTEKDPLINLLHKIDAKIGKYWVYGNHDHGGYGTKMVNEIMTESGFILLNNEHIILKSGSEQLMIAGIDDAILGNPNLDHAFANAEENNYTILLAHEPDFADLAVNYSVDLQLSGHSHGGQIRLPFIGHLYTPPYARKYVHGKYELNHGKTTLFVSSGIGTTRLPLRLLCQPEFHTFVLQSTNV